MEDGAERRLCRSNRDRKVLGVCGGLGEYFGIDAALWRVLFMLTMMFGGAGMYLYAGMMLLMPSAAAPPALPPQPRSIGTPALDLRQAALKAWPGLPVSASEKRAKRRRQAGTFIALLGVFLLAANLNILVWLRWDLVWPLFLIALGGLLILRQSSR